MVGKIFGRLTVIKYSHSGKGGRYWECLCSCGNTIYVTTKKLNSKNTRSCGCLHSEIIRMNNVKLKSKINQEEIIGKKFDFLEVIERIDVFKKGPTKYRCYCHNCKNYKVIKYSDLVGDRVHACGCLSSWGEAKLKTLLLNNNINFKTQFSFDDLKSKKNYPLRFDFAIYDKINRMKCLIEYQGDQHKNPENPYWSEELLERDAMKKEYCMENNIKIFYCDKKTDLELFILNLKEVVGQCP